GNEGQRGGRRQGKEPPHPRRPVRGTRGSPDSGGSRFGNRLERWSEEARPLGDASLPELRSEAIRPDSERRRTDRVHACGAPVRQRGAGTPDTAHGQARLAAFGALTPAAPVPAHGTGASRRAV